MVGGGTFGFVQLAASADDAAQGRSIDLSGALPAGTHALARSNVTTAVFNPAALRSADSAPASTTVAIGNHKLNVLAGSTYEAKADSLTGGFGLLAGATVTKSSATVDGETLAYVGESTSVTAGELDVIATSDDDAHSLNEFYAIGGGLTVNVTISDATIDSRTEAFTGTMRSVLPCRMRVGVVTPESFSRRSVVIR